MRQYPDNLAKVSRLDITIILNSLALDSFDMLTGAIPDDSPSLQSESLMVACKIKIVAYGATKQKQSVNDLC